MATWIDSIVAQKLRELVGYRQLRMIEKAQAKHKAELEAVDDQLAMEEVYCQALEILIRDGQT